MKALLTLAASLALASASSAASADGEGSSTTTAQRPAVVVTHVTKNGGQVLGATEIPHGPLTAAATHVEIRGQKLALPPPGAAPATLTIVDHARLIRRGTTMDRPLPVTFLTLHTYEAHSTFGVPYTAHAWVEGPKVKLAAKPVVPAKK